MTRGEPTALTAVAGLCMIVGSLTILACLLYGAYHLIGTLMSWGWK